MKAPAFTLQRGPVVWRASAPFRVCSPLSATAAIGSPSRDALVDRRAAHIDWGPRRYDEPTTRSRRPERRRRRGPPYPHSPFLPGTAPPTWPLASRPLFSRRHTARWSAAPWPAPAARPPCPLHGWRSAWSARSARQCSWRTDSTTSRSQRHSAGSRLGSTKATRSMQSISTASKGTQRNACAPVPAAVLPPPDACWGAGSGQAQQPPHQLLPAGAHTSWCQIPYSKAAWCMWWLMPHPWSPLHARLHPPTHPPTHPRPACAFVPLLAAVLAEQGRLQGEMRDMAQAVRREYDVG